MEQFIKTINIGGFPDTYLYIESIEVEENNLNYWVSVINAEHIEDCDNRTKLTTLHYYEINAHLKEMQLSHASDLLILKLAVNKAKKCLLQAIDKLTIVQHNLSNIY